jgi:hypothetical protein
MLTEQRVMDLVTIATEYAEKHNLIVNEYLQAMLNPDTIGNADAKVIVETLIRYHKEWLTKSL